MISKLSASQLQPLIPSGAMLLIGIFQPWGIKGDIICLILSLCCFVAGFIYMKKRISAHNKINESAIVCKLIRHQRHDWLNHVQVIMGYQMMNQSEKMANYLQKIIQTANHERKISDFAFPPLAAQLLTIGYDYPQWHWEVVLDDDLSFHKIEQEKHLYQLLQVLLPWFVQEVKQEKQWMKIVLSLSQRNKMIVLTFDCIAEEDQETNLKIDEIEITAKMDTWAATCEWSGAGQCLVVQMPVAVSS